MLHIKDELAGEVIEFFCAETREDAQEIYNESCERDTWALDTESTGINCYRPGWRLRTFQFGNARTSYVVPAKFRRTIARIINRRGVRWIGHNGPHDIRCLDEFLGYRTGVVCAGETFIVAHHWDPRSPEEGGIGHELKEVACAIVDPRASRWEAELKAAFKQIQIPIKGEVYKSGPRKGAQKMRKARLEEGWALIDPMHPAYIAYAAVDPILTYRVWRKLIRIYRDNRRLYRFDLNVQRACDKLQRRAMLLDIAYTERLSAAFTSRAEKLMDLAAEYGCANIHSGVQIAETLIGLGARLTARTPTGKFTTADHVLREIMNNNPETDIAEFVRCVLGAKQLLKRRESYSDAMLREADKEGRVHPSIKSLGARTTRMSVSRPPLQQLPTKDREDELG